MKKYVIVDSINGSVKSIMQWDDIVENVLIEVNGKIVDKIMVRERGFPNNWIFNENEILITCESNDDVCLYYRYNHDNKTFYTPEVDFIEVEIEGLKWELGKLELELSNFQEATWQAMMIDETKLPQEWQDRLNRKREIRARLSELGVVVEI